VYLRESEDNEEKSLWVSIQRDREEFYNLVFNICYREDIWMMGINTHFHRVLVQ